VWFRNHAPQLAGSVVSVVLTPIVCQVVQAAGEAVAARFKEAID
jgi:hypothetical protein